MANASEKARTKNTIKAKERKLSQIRNRLNKATGAKYRKELSQMINELSTEIKTLKKSIGEGKLEKELGKGLQEAEATKAQTAKYKEGIVDHKQQLYNEKEVRETSGRSQEGQKSSYEDPRYVKEELARLQEIDRKNDERNKALIEETSDYKSPGNSAGYQDPELARQEVERQKQLAQKEQDKVIVEGSQLQQTEEQQKAAPLLATTDKLNANEFTSSKPVDQNPYGVNSTGSEEAIGGGQSQNPGANIQVDQNKEQMIENLKRERDTLPPGSKERDDFNKEHIIPLMREEGKAKPVKSDYSPTSTHPSERPEEYDTGTLWKDEKGIDEVDSWGVENVDGYNSVGTLNDKISQLTAEKARLEGGVLFTKNKDPETVARVQVLDAQIEKLKGMKGNKIEGDKATKIVEDLTEKRRVLLVNGLDLNKKDKAELEKYSKLLPQQAPVEGGTFQEEENATTQAAVQNNQILDSTGQPMTATDLRQVGTRDNPIEFMPGMHVQKDLVYKDENGDQWRATESGRNGHMRNISEEGRMSVDSMKKRIDDPAAQQRDQVEMFRAEAKTRAEEIKSLIYESTKNIEPQRYINNMSTGKSIGLALAMFGSAMSSGALGKTNEVMAMLDKSIERDIDVQEKNLEAKRSRLKFLESEDDEARLLFEQRSLTAGTRQLQAYDMVQKKILQLMNKAPPKIKKKYEQLFKEIQDKKDVMGDIWGDKFQIWYTQTQQQRLIKSQENATKLKTQQQKDLGNIRKEFEGNQTIKDWNKTRTAWSTFNTAIKKNTAVGDHSAIFQYFRILDPASTVREGEFDVASNLGTFPQNVKAWMEKHWNPKTGFLNSEIRQQFINTVRDLALAKGRGARTFTQRYDRYGNDVGIGNNYFSKNLDLNLEGIATGDSIKSGAAKE